MVDDRLTGERGTLTGENLPRVGKNRTHQIRAREELDLREREVFRLRRNGHTFQEIAELLTKRAAEIFQSSGKQVDYYSSASGVKKAYDRYVMRSPERFDLEGRRQAFELALSRAEANYRSALMNSRNTTDQIACARWSEIAGKWFDRIINLEGLSVGFTVSNNLTQNYLVNAEASLILKINAALEASAVFALDSESQGFHGDSKNPR